MTKGKTVKGRENNLRQGFVFNAIRRILAAAAADNFLTCQEKF